MYFAFGWPKYYSTGTSEVILDIKYNTECSLIACLTTTSIILWSGDQNRTRIGHSTRKDESIQTTGGNAALCWAPDSSLLAVTTTGGHIYLYVIRKEWQDPLEFTYIQPNHITYSLSTPTSKLLHISLASSFLVAHGGAFRLCGEEELLYIVTKNNYIVVMRWTGDIAEQFSISDVQLLDPPATISAALQDIPINEDGLSSSSKIPQLPPGSIKQFTYAPSIHTFCVVLSNGSTVVMQAKSTGTSLVQRLRAYFLSFPGNGGGKAVCTAINALHRLVAVGCDGGDVKLYKIPQSFPHVSQSSTSKLQQLPQQTVLVHAQPGIAGQTQTSRVEPQGPPKIGPARIFTLLHWGIRGEDTGPVAVVVWTRDERALAVGWAKRGFSLWSINGCRLVCTIPQLEGFGVPKAKAGESGQINDNDVPSRNHPNSPSHDPSSPFPPLSHLVSTDSSAPIPTNLSAPIPTNLSDTLNSADSTTPSPHNSSTPYFSSELARDGVKTLALGAHSYHLLVATQNSNGTLMQLSLVKSCLACNPTFCYSERILLQADDRLLFMCYKGNVPGEVEWKHLHIPHTYLLDNWPMRFAAMSRDGTQIAVTGRRGLILYNNTTGRWKMFGDRNQEQEIICAALCWFRHTVVLASLNETIGKYELLMFPRQHLSYSSIAGRQELPRRRIPHLMDCNDSYLVLFTKDCCLYLYSISTSGSAERATVQLELYHQVSLASVAVPLTITLLPESPQHVRHSSSIPAVSAPHLRAPPQCLIHYTSGKLALLHLAENREDELATDVEQPWLGTALTDFEELSDLSPPLPISNSNIPGPLTSPRKTNLVSESAGRTLWAYGEQGLTVWVPFPGPHKQLMSRDRSLDFDNEVYPVGFVSDLGIVVGLTQGVSIGLGAQLPFFEIHTKTHPFLHSILRNKIDSFDDAQALSIAKKFEYVPHFAHSLELLLHEVLESECENQPLAKSSGRSDPLSDCTLLSRVANFMRNFPQFPDIVVQCARKTDAAYWQFLFDGVGDPRELFEDCVKASKFSTAASYLKILQNICPEGHIVSRRAALVLLEKVLEIDDVELAGELTRFLGPIPKPLLSTAEKRDMIATHNSFHYNSNHSPLVDVGITPDDEEYYMQEFQLGKYVRKLLMRKQLRHLLLFAWRVGHSLRPWLEKERSQSATLDSLEEWKSALTAMHLQFYIPKPDRLPPIPATIHLDASPRPSNTPASANPADLTPPPSPIPGSSTPSPFILPNSLPPTSPLGIAASTPFARKMPLPTTGLALSTSSLIPDTHDTHSVHETNDKPHEELVRNGPVHADLPDLPGSSTSTLNSSSSVISSHSASALSLPSMRDPLFLQDSIEYAAADLAYLQEEMLAAKCIEWGLIIATVLMNITVIVTILRRAVSASKANLWDTYRQLLVSQESSSHGYYELRLFLDELFYAKRQ